MSPISPPPEAEAEKQDTSAGIAANGVKAKEFESKVNKKEKEDKKDKGKKEKKRKATEEADKVSLHPILQSGPLLT